MDSFAIDDFDFGYEHGRGRGYDWSAGKSNNAVAAEEEGLSPASVIARRYGLESQAVSEILTVEEWHHTSAAFNETWYYRAEEAEEKMEALRERSAELRAQREAYRKDSHIFYDCLVWWTEKIKNGRRFEEVERAIEAKKVVGRGQTVTAYPKSGGREFKKRACEVIVRSSRNLDDKAELIARSISRFGLKRDYCDLLLVAMPEDTAPYHNLIRIEWKAVTALAKRNAVIRQAIKDAKEESRRMKILEKKEKAFEDSMQRQLGREFVKMLKSVFGRRAVIVEKLTMRSGSEEIPITNRIVAPHPRLAHYFAINGGGSVSGALFCVNAKRTLEEYLNGKTVTEIEIDDHRKIVGAKA